MSPFALELTEVRKTFPSPAGPVEALHQVDLSVERGEFVALTGPSGSGKSTCLHLAALLDRPTTGRIRFDGEDVSELGEPELCSLRRQKVGMVFQRHYLLPHRTARENVLFRFRYTGCRRSEAQRRTSRALEFLGLTQISERPARVLSGGEMQRVVIARAIALEPRLLLADEPTGDLDGESAERVMECFRRLHESGITILMATHNRQLLEFCSRHVACRNGCVRS